MVVVLAWYPATIKRAESRIITGLPAISGTEFLIPSPAFGDAAAVDRVATGRAGGLMVTARRLTVVGVVSFEVAIPCH